jgi:hypothetical protein
VLRERSDAAGQTTRLTAANTPRAVRRSRTRCGRVTVLAIRLRALVRQPVRLGVPGAALDGAALAIPMNPVDLTAASTSDIVADG